LRKRAVAALCAAFALPVVALASRDAPPSRSGAPIARVAAADRHGHCDRFAGPRGSDRAAGTHRRPFRTVRHLVRSLRRGWTGCLLPGRYRHRGPVELRRPRVTLRSVKGARARVDGAIWIDAPARGAQVADLFLTTSDPTFSIPLKVQADGASVKGNVITGRRLSTICIVVGSAGRAHGAVIEGNRITRCGLTGKLDHLIYLVHSRGSIVRHNVLSHNPGGWAVHLYPDADGNLIEHNVMAANHGGVIFAGDGSQASDDNVVRGNAILDSAPRFNIEASWSGGAEGSGNRAEGNCLYTTGGSGAPAGVDESGGFTVSGSVVPPSPPFSIGARGGYRLARGGPCAAVVAGPAGPAWLRQTSRKRSRSPRQR
jgi:Right handed beta helix region